MLIIVYGLPISHVFPPPPISASIVQKPVAVNTHTIKPYSSTPAIKPYTSASSTSFPDSTIKPFKPYTPATTTSSTIKPYTSSFATLVKAPTTIQPKSTIQPTHVQSKPTFMTLLPYIAIGGGLLTLLGLAATHHGSSTVIHAVDPPLHIQSNSKPIYAAHPPTTGADSTGILDSSARVSPSTPVDPPARVHSSLPAQESSGMRTVLPSAPPTHVLPDAPTLPKEHHESNPSIEGMSNLIAAGPSSTINSAKPNIEQIIDPLINSPTRADSIESLKDWLPTDPNLPKPANGNPSSDFSFNNPIDQSQRAVDAPSIVEMPNAGSKEITPFEPYTPDPSYIDLYDKIRNNWLRYRKDNGKLIGRLDIEGKLIPFDSETLTEIAATPSNIFYKPEIDKHFGYIRNIDGEVSLVEVDSNGKQLIAPIVEDDAPVDLHADSDLDVPDFVPQDPGSDVSESDDE